ncbi:MAG: hypothetical protein KC502_19785, partial [Myxococcales bacterium]|nr:hypothetical protein [Myxococcales bacterium]
MTKKFRLGVLLALLCIAAPAWAAPPATTTIEGVLTSAGGGAAADGTYAVTFSIYASKTATSAAWSEAGVKVVLKNGRFQHRLGSIKALNPKTLAALKTPWFGVKVATDPELARMPLSSALYALVAGQVSCTGCIGGAQLASGAISPAKIGFNYAGSTTKGGPAKDLSCSGCVSVSELKFDGNVN